MSRVGKQLITIPQGTTMTVSGGTVLVKGPLGELSRDFSPLVSITVEGQTAKVTPRDEKENAALWGTAVAHLKNMVSGVNKAFEKKLVIEGIGYRAEVSGDSLTFNLGFSHQVKVKVPAGLAVTAEKNVLTISGSDRERLGQFAAEVRALRKPEPYKGKGIRYEGEVVRRKEGKKTVA